VRTAPNHLYLKKESDFYEPRQPTIPSFTNLSLECTSSKRASTSSTRERERERAPVQRKEGKFMVASVGYRYRLLRGIYASIPAASIPSGTGPSDTHSKHPERSVRSVWRRHHNRKFAHTLRHLYPHK